jgi:CheY-like chemotaxis protein
MKVSPSVNAPAARILLVDDNRLGLIARKSVLEDLGYRITTATEGQDAFEKFSREEFDLIITDYKMPKMDGLKLIERIRQTAADLPIILISGYAEALGMTEANTGADVVIAKSASEVPQLVRSVNRLLHRPVARKPVGSQRGTSRLRQRGAC